MAFPSLKDLMDTYTNIEVDKQFINRVLQFVQKFANKNEEHTNFFGGHLLGVYRAVWMDEVDGRYWLEEICGIIDIEDCQNDIYELDGIESRWRVASSLMNLSFLYVAHRIATSRLSQDEKEIGIVYTIIGAHMKHLTSGMRNRFRFKANESIAMAHYESLDYRSDLKKAGSWFELLKMRGEQVVSDKFLWRQQLQTFQGTYDVAKWANDLQDRLTDVLNALTESFHRIKDQEARIGSFSRIGEHEGVKVVGNVRSFQRELIEDLKGRYKTKAELIKESLLEDTMTVVTTADIRYLRDTLSYMSENSRVLRPQLDELSEELVIMLFDVSRGDGISLTDVPAMISKCRDYYRSSRTKRKDLITIKRLCVELVEEAVPRARPAMRVATGVALYIYLILRIFTLKSGGSSST